MDMAERKRKAIRLRKTGKSYGEIYKALGISKSTLSYWLKNIRLSPKHRARLYTARIKNMVRGSGNIQERRALEIETVVSAAKMEIALPLAYDAERLFGAALYWAEGTKSGGLTITNSDPLMILFMVHWIQREFKIAPRELKAWLNMYPQQNDADIKSFWSGLTGIPLSRFGKSFVKPLSKGYKKNNLYYGTIKIRVPKSSDMRHRVYGWIQTVLHEHDAELARLQKKWIRLTTVEKPANMD